MRHIFSLPKWTNGPYFRDSSFALLVPLSNLLSLLKGTGTGEIFDLGEKAREREQVVYFFNLQSKTNDFLNCCTFDVRLYKMDFAPFRIPTVTRIGQILLAFVVRKKAVMNKFSSNTCAQETILTWLPMTTMISAVASHRSRVGVSETGYALRKDTFTSLWGYPVVRDKVTCTVTLTGYGEGGWGAKFCKIIVYRVFLMQSFAKEEKRKNKLKKYK